MAKTVKQIETTIKSREAKLDRYKVGMTDTKKEIGKLKQQLRVAREAKRANNVAKRKAK